MKKIGIIIQYYNTRKDIPQLVEAFSKNWEVVLFVSTTDSQEIDSRYEKRLVAPIPKSLRYRFIRLLYACFGQLPTSRMNYRNWLAQRRNQMEKKSLRTKQWILDLLRINFGNLFCFDRYLGCLSQKSDTKIDDIDLFLGFTDLCNIQLVADILRAKKPYLTYVYSWDHAAKQHQHLKSGTVYLTWHNEIKNDLIREQNTPPEIIKVVGSSQLGLTLPFVRTCHSLNEPVDNDYVYFGAATAWKVHVAQEIKVIKFIAKILMVCAPRTKLLVRPYPFALKMNYYSELLELKNISIDNISAGSEGTKFQPDSLRDKYSKIKNAKMFVHMGSTVGMEAAYFDTPVVMVAMNDFDYGLPKKSKNSFLRLFEQPHISKYLTASDEINVVRRQEDLEPALTQILASPKSYLRYNKEFESTLPLQSINEIASSITRIGKDLIIE